MQEGIKEFLAQKGDTQVNVDQKSTCVVEEWFCLLVPGVGDHWAQSCQTGCPKRCLKDQGFASDSGFHLTTHPGYSHHLNTILIMLSEGLTWPSNSACEFPVSLRVKDLAKSS